MSESELKPEPARPGWMNRRLVPQVLVIAGLIGGTVAYIPQGRPHAVAEGIQPAVEASDRELVVVVNGETKTIHTQALTVGQVLHELGLLGHAVANVPEDTLLSRLNGPLTIDAAKEVSIVAGNKTFTIYTRSQTVGELMKKTGLELNVELSRSKGVSPTSAIRDGMTVYVRTLKLPLTVTEEEQIPYTSEQFVDPSLEPGTRQVIRAGQVGSRQRVYRVEVGKDGSLRRVLVSTQTVREPVSEKVAIGYTPTPGETEPYPIYTAAPQAQGSIDPAQGWNITPVIPGQGGTGTGPSYPTPGGGGGGTGTPSTPVPTAPAPTPAHTTAPTTPPATPKPTPTPTAPKPTGPAPSQAPTSDLSPTPKAKPAKPTSAVPPATGAVPQPTPSETVIVPKGS